MDLWGVLGVYAEVLLFASASGVREVLRRYIVLVCCFGLDLNFIVARLSSPRGTSALTPSLGSWSSCWPK